MIRIWLLLNYPERTADGPTVHCGSWDADSSPRIAQPALPKMSSQAKVKKDKEIIAEYETQVKGW